MSQPIRNWNQKLEWCNIMLGPNVKLFELQVSLKSKENISGKYLQKGYLPLCLWLAVPSSQPRETFRSNSFKYIQKDGMWYKILEEKFIKVNIVCNSCFQNRLKICTGPSTHVVPYEISEFKHSLIPPASLPRARSIGKWRADNFINYRHMHKRKEAEVYGKVLRSSMELWV